MRAHAPIRLTNWTTGKKGFLLEDTSVVSPKWKMYTRKDLPSSSMVDTKCQIQIRNGEGKITVLELSWAYRDPSKWRSDMKKMFRNLRSDDTNWRRYNRTISNHYMTEVLSEVDMIRIRPTSVFQLRSEESRLSEVREARFCGSRERKSPLRWISSRAQSFLKVLVLK